MAEPTYNPSFAGQDGRSQAGPKTFLRGWLFGVPVKDMGLIASFIMSVAAGLIAFCAVTFLAIVSVLVYNGMGHNVDFAATYKYFGAPAGALMLVLALAYMIMLWVRRQVTRRD